MSLSIGYCGVCCNHCGMNSHIPMMAEELKRFIQAYKYRDWIEHIIHDFKFKNFMNGLNWFAKAGCNGCLQGGGMPNCEVRNCCRGKGFKNCYFCPDFEKCEKLHYQKSTYKIDDNYVIISQVGYENWLKEQEEKANEGFDNINFLE